MALILRKDIGLILYIVWGLAAASENLVILVIACFTMPSALIYVANPKALPINIMTSFGYTNLERSFSIAVALRTMHRTIV